MKQAETYLYAEFKGKVKRFNYSLGIGGTRSWMSAQGNGYQDYTLRPTISLKYNLTDKSSIKYTANLYSSSPSLSDLENVEQIVDSMQIRRGNSQLKPYMVYAHSLNYEMSKGIFNGGVYVGTSILIIPSWKVLRWKMGSLFAAWRTKRAGNG
jgi:hypothetical protein